MLAKLVFKFASQIDVLFEDELAVVVSVVVVAVVAVLVLVLISCFIPFVVVGAGSNSSLLTLPSFPVVNLQEMSFLLLLRLKTPSSNCPGPVARA